MSLSSLDWQGVSDLRYSLAFTKNRIKSLTFSITSIVGQSIVVYQKVFHISYLRHFENRQSELMIAKVSCSFGLVDVMVYV